MNRSTAPSGLPQANSKSEKSYASVDALQKTLVDEVFTYATDKKKAAGRALGTLVEIITFYMFKAWGLRDNVSIERPLGEYANASISHNVEYSLHPVLDRFVLPLKQYTLPLTSAKLRKELFRDNSMTDALANKAASILSSNGILRNACVLCESSLGLYVATIDDRTAEGFVLTVALLHRHPFAIFECKRVGVEEGMKKGPQSIEKAKQGAYVARSISALQKVRLRDGSLSGVIPRADGSLYHAPYERLLREVIDSSEPDLLTTFILSVGVVSNHGNWFTQEDHNKELKVLAQSYDWLLFLTDQGLAQFINELLLKPAPEFVPVRSAFLASYNENKSGTRFTKVQMDIEADTLLRHYFNQRKDLVKSWFNVISPKGGTIDLLQKELLILNGKDWRKIYGL